MSNSAIDIDYLKTWEGKKQSYTDDMSPFKAKALHCALDLSRLNSTNAVTSTLPSSDSSDKFP